MREIDYNKAAQYAPGTIPGKTPIGTKISDVLGGIVSTIGRLVTEFHNGYTRAKINQTPIQTNEAGGRIAGRYEGRTSNPSVAAGVRERAAMSDKITQSLNTKPIQTGFKSSNDPIIKAFVSGKKLEG